ncbi:hypothetical protein CKSOR_00281 [Candidatus Kinetoplastibacterium sorsogonicusi]|uniref:Uncharacterized protein n=1 Tax=Candidatus Kinetoplastidibacterium kentomonadis TaxID=1576550 RepID=A0A3S7J9P8_9PROT|nr:hypothetical protein [Candidatus Kinetoplastibacterium sorsogonicusi]AWD32402.1 hypothetical protein CKSOR_00281 [Candidatus Kinetoplastibacterium sorsogonicusi]
MQFKDQELLVDVSTAAIDTGGYGVFLTVTAEGGTEIGTTFSYLGSCESLYEARYLAENFAKNWVAENLLS